MRNGMGWMVRWWRSCTQSAYKKYERDGSAPWHAGSRTHTRSSFLPTVNIAQPTQRHAQPDAIGAHWSWGVEGGREGSELYSAPRCSGDLRRHEGYVSTY